MRSLEGDYVKMTILLLPVQKQTFIKTRFCQKLQEIGIIYQQRLNLLLH